MKNTKTNWIIGAVALLVLPLILQSFGNAWAVSYTHLTLPTKRIV